MSNKTIAFAVSVFILVVVSLFSISYLYKQKKVDNIEPQAPIAVIPVDRYNVKRIDGKHFFKNGTHTVVGEITLPTPCDLLKTEAIIAESYPEQVTFLFTVINTTDTCAMVATNQRFKVEARASSQANLKATFNGSAVELNLIEASADETPEEFELFIKG